MVHIYAHILCTICVCTYIRTSSYMHKSLHTCIFLQYVIIKSVVLTMSVTVLLAKCK